MTQGAVHTTCPYCGVGCGVVAQPDETIKADTGHPSNRGRLCSKGAALAATLDNANRLTAPTIGGMQADWDTALQLVADRFKAAVAEHGPDSVAFYGSGQCLTEDYYVANKLMKGFIGSANIDTNSRLCMASTVAGHMRAFGEDVMPGVYEDWEDADLVVLVGSNAAWCHPVLHQRMTAARAAHGTKVVVLDPRRTATAEAADLHLPLAAGTDVALFNGLLRYLVAAGKVNTAWVERHTVGLEAAVAGDGGSSPTVSWPGLVRPARTGAADPEKVVGGRAKPGHDTGSHDMGSQDTGNQDTGNQDTGSQDTGSQGKAGHGAAPHDTRGRYDSSVDIDSVAAICGIDPEALETFYDLFAKTERVMTVYSQGVNQSSAGTDKVNAIINCHLATGRIGRPGMGPFSVTGQPNAMGGREVGGLANQLAAHMRFDDPADRAALQAFWRSPTLAPKPGLKAVDLFDAVADGRIKALWIAATNPAVSLPRVGAVRDALKACPFVVVSDCWPTDTSALAHVVLPAAGWGEKDGTVTSSERRISRQRPFRPAPGEARPDWRQLAEVGRRMGWADAFAWISPAAVFREHAALSAYANKGRRAFDIGAKADITDADYDAMQPFRWPLPAGAASEAGRLFAEGGFSTPDGKARFVPTPFREAPKAPQGGVLLNTGRVRDQWHTMTRTGLAPALMSHTPEPTLALNPADAAAACIADGGLARLRTDHGEIVLRAELRHTIRRGEAFVPMHWTDRFTSAGPIGRVVTARADPVSGQPELKATPASVGPVAATFHGLLLRRRDGAPAPDDFPDLHWPDLHWVRIPVTEGHLYRLTGLSPMPAGEALSRFAAALTERPADADWLEMADTRRGVLRAAIVSDGALEACLFLARDPAMLPAEQAVIPMIGAPVPDSARANILSGRMYGATANEGPKVCACFGVSRDAIRHAIATENLTTVRQIGELLRAGTSCGSCIPELQEILRDVRILAE